VFNTQTAQWKRQGKIEGMKNENKLMKDKEKHKIKGEWSLQLAKLKTYHLKELLKYKEGKETNKELIEEILKISKEHKKNYYDNKETERIFKIKKGVLTDEIIKKQESTYKKHLFEKIIRYGYKIEYVKKYINLINLEYLVNVKDFFNLKDGSYIEKKIPEILEYEDIIKDFISNLNKKDIEEYNKTKYANPKYIYPLIMNEYVESTKS
jgi:hypothetical protein